jgi:tetrahydromethanopterin S-methyltransferase subunit H
MSHFQVLQIGDTVIGGPIGVATGLAVGSIYYDNHSVLKDAFSGEFNQSRAEALVAQVNRASRRYAVQMAFDVIAAFPEAMEKFLEFVGSRTNLPLLINSTD